MLPLIHADKEGGRKQAVMLVTSIDLCDASEAITKP